MNSGHSAGVADSGACITQSVATLNDATNCNPLQRYASRHIAPDAFRSALTGPLKRWRRSCWRCRLSAVSAAGCG